MSIKRKYILIILSVMTLFASAAKVVIGLDFDENYITVLGARLLQGDHLFRECWDLYQTTGLTMALVLGIYRNITGGYEGAIIFCRIVTAVLQSGLGIFVYRSLRKHYKNADFAGIFVANMLPRGTMNLEYGFLCCAYILISMCLLTCYYKDADNWTMRKKIGTIVASGLCFSMGMLSYPTMLVCVLVLAVFFFGKGREKASVFCPILFFGTCLACAVIFFVYVLRYISLQDLIVNIRDGIMMDASHGNGNLLRSFLGSFNLSREKWLQVFCMIVFSLGMSVIYWIFCKQRMEMVYHVMLTSSLVLILLNISTLRPCGVFGLQIRYVLMVLFFIPVAYRMIDREIACLFWGMGIFMLIGTLLGSNLGIAENGAFLYLSLLAIILEQGQKTWKSQKAENYAMLAVVCMMISLLILKGFVVRVNHTKPANILTAREQIGFGPFAGIYMDSEQKEGYLIRKRTMDCYIQSEDVVLVMSQDPVYNLMSEARFTSVTALTTPIYGKQWVEYYKNRDYGKPTVILIDKAYFDLDSVLYNTEFGGYIRETMDMDTLIDAEGFWMVRA